MPGHGDLPFFHGFQQCGLDFGWGAVDFVGEDDVAEQRARLETNAVAFGRLLQDLAAGDVRRQQVGGELDAPHLRLQVRGQGFYRARLGQAREAFEQQMAVGEQAQQHVTNGLCLAEDLLRDRGFQGLDVFMGVHGGGGSWVELTVW
ncbi:hypothetical protein D3C76_1443850 [compost metagenome]